MLHGSLTRRSALKSIAAGAVSGLSVWLPMRGLRAQSGTALKFGRVPVNALVSNYIGEVDFFREEGVPLELVRVDNPGQLFQAMTAGDLAVGEIGLGPSLIAAIRGLPLIAPFLGSMSTPDHPFERIMVLQDSPIKTLDDLKGKRLGYQGPGSVPDLLLSALPRKSKISKTDIQLLQLPPPSQPDALGQKLVDAIFSTPPVDTVAELKYGARTLANATDLVPYSGLGTLVVRRDFAEQHPDAVKKVLTAAIRFSRWIDDNPVKARLAMGKNLGLPDDIPVHSRLPLFARNGLSVMPNVWQVYQMLVDAKTVDPAPDPEKVINTAIVEPTERFTLPAVTVLGMQPDPAIEQMTTGEYPLLAKPNASYYADWERRMLKL